MSFRKIGDRLVANHSTTHDWQLVRIWSKEREKKRTTKASKLQRIRTKHQQLTSSQFYVQSYRTLGRILESYRNNNSWCIHEYVSLSIIRRVAEENVCVCVCLFACECRIHSSMIDQRSSERGTDWMKGETTYGFGLTVILRLSRHCKSVTRLASGTSGRHVNINDLPTGFRWTDCIGRISRRGSFWHRTSARRKRKFQLNTFIRRWMDTERRSFTMRSEIFSLKSFELENE